ncbi:MAG: glutamate formimidoyltransferase [Acidobacteria bacterium]|nr:glutamate formimidoyltransferase [Acidobacteriota bacterium]
MERIVECVPNFSEGRGPEIVNQIVSAIESVKGVVVIDREMDADHHRCVITYVGEPDDVVEAAVRATRKAAELIDLNKHQGEHPRIGATDVIPFIPIRNVSMDECVELARRAGKRIAEELGIPVYLYEQAATRPDRENLANIRKGEFEGLREAMGADPDRAPDFGEPRVHPTAGATVVGARAALIAYNVNLNTNNLDIAKKIARAIRGRDGGLSYVKALGFELKDRGIVQVSMNLVNYEKTPIFRALEFVKREAEHYGVMVIGSQIVGLVPQAALDACAERSLQLEGFSRNQVLENRLQAALSQRREDLSKSIGQFPDLVAAGTSVPGGGSVAALSGALAAALGQMMCTMTIGKKKFAEVEGQVRDILSQLGELRSSLTKAIAEDAASFDRVMAAYQLAKETEEGKQARAQAVQEAMKGAALVPLQTAHSAYQVLQSLYALVEVGNPNLLADVAVGGQLALAAIKGAYYNVVVNLHSITDEEFNNQHHSRILEIVEQAEELTEQLESAVLEKIAAA